MDAETESGAVPEGLICDNPGEDQTERKRYNHQDCVGKPGGGFGQRHDAEVIDGAVKIQPGNHDDDRRNRNGNPRISGCIFQTGG